MLSKYRDSLNFKLILLKEWKGHKLGVTGITSCGDPEFYASSGQDLRIIIWNQNFEQIGTLTTIRDPNWSLKIDIEKKNLEKKEKAEQLFEEIKNKPYDKLFDGDMNLPTIEVILFIKILE